jgi:hypothetical protein
MKNTILKVIGGALLTFAIFTIFTQISVKAQVLTKDEMTSDDQFREDDSTRSENANRLVGVWNVTVTRRNCLTGVEIGTAQAMLSFAFGGTMSDWGTGNPPSLRSPGHGIWSYESRGSYNSAFQFFRFNADGTLAGRQIVRSEIQLSRDGTSLTNSAMAQILDVNGNVIATNCSTATATRFE